MGGVKLVQITFCAASLFEFGSPSGVLLSRQTVQSPKRACTVKFWHVGLTKPFRSVKKHVAQRRKTQTHIVRGRAPEILNLSENLLTTQGNTLPKRWLPKNLMQVMLSILHCDQMPMEVFWFISTTANLCHFVFSSSAEPQSVGICSITVSWSIFLFHHMTVLSAKKTNVIRIHFLIHRLLVYGLKCRVSKTTLYHPSDRYTVYKEKSSRWFCEGTDAPLARRWSKLLI